MNWKIKQIKSNIKNKNYYVEYKKSFKKRNSLFLLSTISLIFQSNISIEKMSEFELYLCKNINDKIAWGKCFDDISIYFLNDFRNCDWKNFGYFMYYNWNKNIFIKNELKNESIYTYDNFNQLNDLKSKHYNKWIDSILNTKNINFNLYIRKVLKSI